MAGEGWQGKKTRVSAPPLATWADNNGLSKRLACLISDGEATQLVIEIVKKFRATHGATITSVAKAKMLRELDAAGQWSKSGKTAASQQAAPARRRAAFSGDAAKDSRSYAAVAAGAGANRAEAALRQELQAMRKANANLTAALKANVNQDKALRGRAAAEDQPSRRARRAARRDSRTRVDPAAMPVEEEEDTPAVAGWQCTLCERLHPRPTKQCRVCWTKREVATADSDGRTAHSEAQIAVERTKLEAVIAMMTASGHCQSKRGLSHIAELQAQLVGMSAPSAPTPVLDDTARLGAAQKAVDNAVARVAKYTESMDGLNNRLKEMQLDIEALQRARADAVQLQMEAERALASVQQEVGARAMTPGHTAAAAPAPQVAGSQSAHHDKARSVLARRLEALSKLDSDVLKQIRDQLEVAGGADPTITVANMVAKYIESMQQELDEDVPTVTTAESATPTAPVRAPPARLAAATAMGGTDGDTQLNARVSVKLAAQAQTSAAQAAKQAAAGNQRVGKRQQNLDGARKLARDEFIRGQEGDLAARDAREADELSDDGSAA